MKSIFYMGVFGIALLGLVASVQAEDYQFNDVTIEAGVTNEDHSHFGATFSDFDGDNRLDLYVVNDDENTLYRNNGDGTFTDVTELTGAGDPFVAMRNVWADYDRDGDLDFYSHNFGTSTLYQNNDNFFVDVNVESGAGLKMPHGTGATWVDLDNDGWLDIVATGFPGENILYHNNQDGTFTDLQPTSGMPLESSGMGNTACDYDNDGLQDIVVAAVTNQDTNFLFHNEGNNTFTLATENAGITVEEGSSNSAVNCVDYDNDGFMDILIAEVNLGSRKTLPERLYLFRNNGNGTFTDVTQVAGIIPHPDADEFWDAAFADFDNDGDLDLYVGATGPSSFFRNNGDGTFTDIAKDLGVDYSIQGKGVLWGDYDKDGDIDLYVIQRELPGQEFPANILLNNTGGRNKWLQIELKGTCSNWDAIGARITVMNKGKRQVREVSGGSGLFVQHSPIQQFGLGRSNSASIVIVSWPSGIKQRVFGVRPNKLLRIIEPSSFCISRTSEH